MMAKRIVDRLEPIKIHKHHRHRHFRFFVALNCLLEFDIEKGAILIDDLDIRDLKLQDLRGLMGIVTQEVILFNETVANNIAYGRADYTLEQIEWAAKLANASEFIQQMPKGYETIIGERGTRLSTAMKRSL